MKGDNRFKLAARLRAAAKRVAERGLFDRDAEADLFRAGIEYSTTDLTRAWDDIELARTERVLLCLFGALASADERRNVPVKGQKNGD